MTRASVRKFGLDFSINSQCVAEVALKNRGHSKGCLFNAIEGSRRSLMK